MPNESETTPNGRHALLLQALLRAMVTGLVDDESAVTVTASSTGGCLVLTVATSAEDAGKVIGRQGRNARALRTIVSAAAAKMRLRCEVNLTDEHLRGHAHE